MYARQSPHLYTNTGYGEIADIVFVIGPDNPGQDNAQQTCEQIAHKCQLHGLKFAILGDGKNPVSQADIQSLPNARHVSIYAHGIVKEGRDGNYSHHISLGPYELNNSLTFIQALQNQTGAKNVLLAACYAGKVNEDIKQGGNILEGTELVALSSSDEVSSMVLNSEAMMSLINNIEPGEKTNQSMAKFFGNWIKYCPETITYGTQYPQEFDSFTARRTKRSEMGAIGIQQFVNYNLERFNNHLQYHDKQPVQVTPMSQQEIERYQGRAFLHHVWHFDGDAIERLIDHDSSIVMKCGYPPMSYVLTSFASFMSAMNKSDDAINKTMASLLRHDMQSLTSIVNDPYFFHESYTDRNHYLRRCLTGIVQDPDLLNRPGDENTLNSVKHILYNLQWNYQDVPRNPPKHAADANRQDSQWHYKIPTDIPYHPEKQLTTNKPNIVESHHLHDNGKLLPDEHIALAKSKLIGKDRWMLKMNGALISAKKMTGIKIQKFKDPNTGEERLFAIYLGIRHKQYGEDGKALGKGASGKVKLMQDLETGTWYALKIQNINSNSQTQKEIAQKEFGNLHLRGETIGAIWETNQGQQRFLMAMKLAPGESILETFIAKNNPGISEDQRLLAGSNIAQQFAKMHQEGLIHCDIKSDNINYDLSTDTASVLDLGLANRTGTPISQMGATPLLAPELTTNATAKPAVDVYALSLTLAEMYGMLDVTNTGMQPPHHQKLSLMRGDDSRLNNAHISNPYTREQVRQLLVAGTDPHPDNRPSMQQLSDMLKAYSQQLGKTQITRSASAAFTASYQSRAKAEDKLCQVLNAYQPRNIKDIIKKVTALSSQGVDIHTRGTNGESGSDILLRIEEQAQQRGNHREIIALQALKEKLTSTNTQEARAGKKEEQEIKPSR